MCINTDNEDILDSELTVLDIVKASEEQRGKEKGRKNKTIIN